ncbi:putative LTR transposable element [Pseudoloma neurophilia]|uniref:Putative LTR transposable element n=1 Tax=Pseudoloma neurophilia TaxID=146866 RepID=A0A0R0LSE2_9MICR|nr:putative LTR transposable element [Pseudoloma neurophilia]
MKFKTEQDDVLRRSKSLYVAPSFSEDKENGDPRVLIDYRGLNMKTEDCHNTFAIVNEEFHKMVDCRVFSKLDLRKEYYQIKVKESDKYMVSVGKKDKYESNTIQ